MRKSKYSEEQIIGALKRAEQGVAVKDICRELGISNATFYQWRSKYGGLEASDLRRLKELETENRRLKQMYADLSLDHKIVKDIVEKSSDGQRASRTGRLRDHGPRGKRAAGLPSHRTELVGQALPVQAAR